MARFDLLFEQSFSSTDTINITHNLNRYVFNVRLIISGDPRLSRRELVEDVQLDPSDSLNKCTVVLTGSYSGVVQIIAEDTIQSPYYTVEEKLASQAQTALAGTFPVEFTYGGNSTVGRVLQYVNSSDSDEQPYPIVGDGALRAVSFGSDALNTGTIGIYAIRGASTVLLHTMSFTNSDSETDKPLSIAVYDGDKIYVEQLTGSSNKPYIICYFQTI